MHPNTHSNNLFYIYIVIACAFTFGIYLPGLNGDFYFDDYPNIVNNIRLHLDSLHPFAIWEASWSGITGNLRRPLSVLSFSLNTYFTGLNPVPMKITNLIIHLLCGIGVTILARQLIQQWFRKDGSSNVNLISCLIGAIWLAHPLQLTSVLYVVQRMTSLSTFFSICAISSYCLVRKKNSYKKRKVVSLHTYSWVFNFINSKQRNWCTCSTIFTMH